MVLIGHTSNGTTHWLIDACGDCETSTDKSLAHDFKTIGEAVRGIVLFLKAELRWFVKDAGTVVYTAADIDARRQEHAETVEAGRVERW